MLGNVCEAVGREASQKLLTSLDFMAATSASAIGDKFTLKFSEASKDIDQEIVGWRVFGWKLSEDDGDPLLLKISLDDAEMSNVTGKSVDIIYQDNVEGARGGIVTKAIEFRTA
jgi:hypothetical protein